MEKRSYNELVLQDNAPTITRSLSLLTLLLSRSVASLQPINQSVLSLKVSSELCSGVLIMLPCTLYNLSKVKYKELKKYPISLIFNVSQIRDEEDLCSATQFKENRHFYYSYCVFANIKHLFWICQYAEVKIHSRFMTDILVSR